MNLVTRNFFNARVGERTVTTTTFSSTGSRVENEQNFTDPELLGQNP